MKQRILQPTLRERADKIIQAGKAKTQAEGILKARLELLTEQRQALQKKQKAMLAELKKAESQKRRKAETRRKIILGGWMISCASKNPQWKSFLETIAIPTLAKEYPDLFSGYSVPIENPQITERHEGK